MKLRLLSLSSLLIIAAFGADVTGKWVADVRGRQVTFNLKADGESLTGTISKPIGKFPSRSIESSGEIPISDGKFSRDTVTFSIGIEAQGSTLRQHYTGKLSGDEIHFSVGMEDEKGPEFVAKRSAK